jgi:carboxyl-terminal processing protease
MRSLLGVGLLAALCAGVAPAQSGLTPAERKLNVDSFEQVWQTVRDKHWDPKLGGLDWQAVHDELRPKLEKAATTDAARAVMEEMLSRLKQTHFGIVPGEAYGEVSAATGGDKPEKSTGGPGIDARVIDSQALVISVDPGSPAETAGVKPGWEIVRVEGKEVAETIHKISEGLGSQSTLLDLLQSHAVLQRLDGELGKAVTVEFRDGQNKTVSLKLDRRQPRGKLAILGNLPPLHFWVESRKVQGDIGYVRFNLFFEPEALAQALQAMVKECQNCAGFVVDVRGNPGGIGFLATGVAGWFTEKPNQKLGHMDMRTGTINFPVFPRPEPFKGPLAILVDGNSASTSEVFAAGMKDMKRARIFGTRTAGAALPSVFAKLPNGDGFQYAIANYTSEGGQVLEGIGVKPDEEVKLTRHQLLEGQDPVLDAAVSWIRKQKN